MPRRAWSQRESHCIPYPHALFPLAHNLLNPLPACQPPGGWAPGSHKAGHPASDPSQPPHPGSLEGRDYEPHPELAITHSLSQGFGMSELEGPWEFSQPTAWCTDRRQARKGFDLFQAQQHLGQTQALNLGCLRPTEFQPVAIPGSRRPSLEGPKRSFGPEPLPHFTEEQLSCVAARVTQKSSVVLTEPVSQNNPQRPSA